MLLHERLQTFQEFLESFFETDHLQNTHEYRALPYLKGIAKLTHKKVFKGLLIDEFG